MNSSVLVECYSGYAYAQEPRAFTFEDERRTVIAVRKRWREPTGPCFEVLADDATVYVLVYNEIADQWLIATVRAGCELSDSIEGHRKYS